MMKLKIAIAGFLFMSIFFSCKKEYTPKPHGYFRIAFPEKAYHPLDLQLPYTFDVADYSKAVPDSDRFSEPGWINIITTDNKAELHISYATLNNNLPEHLENSRKFVYKHTIKADAIDEQIYIDRQHKVYGTIYSIDGNAASPMQFHLTDSTRNFLRGALYIRELPNIDSIRPVINFLKPDIIRMIETTRWKN
ncbi:MAG: gliding motility lipoprotein GldD [Bacteroidetes bacterium GWF2_42_66]|nr:MAG: gliding motility lipoprotein GldD [Bacteroidetes bacterium GWA2_42_15]OFY00283.1 MAG: gliding motility lipoprotein GldD [Bacteroidetes bacterium GWE2_42_39]OFY47146.1 MAG: gliding motility lipoprotein GldD [Bacteroidetes bacterium GWF2_42_66]HBL76669.1 gliding motility lipoprotein GldD [Prolixibacteraceae bacterium]HCR89800.1 gliding motility lipoprotein GldD [Prolixibacteraceae bacterium]